MGFQVLAGYKTEWTMKLYNVSSAETLIRTEKYVHAILSDKSGVVLAGPTYNVIGPDDAPIGVFRFDLQKVNESSADFLLTVFDHKSTGEQWRSVVETEFQSIENQSHYIKFSLGDLSNPQNTNGAEVYRLEFELEKISLCDDESTCFVP
jgi:hypothetical protein